MTFWDFLATCGAFFLLAFVGMLIWSLWAYHADRIKPRENWEDHWTRRDEHEP